MILALIVYPGTAIWPAFCAARTEAPVAVALTPDAPADRTA